MPPLRTKEETIAPEHPAGHGGIKTSPWLPWLVLAASLFITWQAWHAAERATEKELRDYFGFRVREAVILTEQRMRVEEQALHGVHGLFSASKSVERKEFRDYVASLHLPENYPGIQGVGFALLVPPAQKDRHVAAVRREGFPQYALRPEGRRDTYTAIVYIEPFSGRNLRAFGYDMYSEPVRRAAMERARDTGAASLSGKVTLVQEDGKNVQAGFLMYLPIYRNGLPHATVAERRASLVGWVYSAFRMDDLAQGMYGERATDLDIEIYDGPAADSAALMYDSHDGGNGAEPLQAIQHLDVAGHPWALRIRSLPGLASRIDTARPRSVAASGLLISALAATLTWLLVNGRLRALRLAQRMNRELTASRERFRALTENMKDVVWVFDTETQRLLYISPSVEGLRGYTPEEALNEPMDRALTPDSAAHVRKLLGQRIRPASTGEDGPTQFYTDEIEQPCKDGGTVWTEVITHLRFNENTGHLEVHGVTRDITERKRMERELLASRSFAVSTINALSAHICVLDETGVILDVNQAWRDFHDENFPGHTGSWIGINYLAICDSASGPYSEEAKPMGAGIRAVMKGERDLFTLEYPCHSPDKQRWFNARVTRFQGGGRVVVAHEDITERKRMEEALRLSEERWKFALEGSGDGVWDWNVQTDATAVSKRFEEILGYGEGEFGHDGKTWRGRIHPDDMANVQVDSRAYMAGASATYTNEHRMLCKDGRYKWVLMRGIVVSRDAAGRPLRMIGTMTDIAERKQAEETLRKLSTAVEQSPTSVIITDNHACIQYVNPRFIDVTGYAADEVVGRNPRMFQSGQTAQETYREMWRRLSRGESWHGELLNRRKNGDTYWEETYISPVKTPSGAVTHYVAVKTDITERKRMEAALTDSEQRYHFLFEDSPFPMYVFEEDSLKFLLVNKQAALHYGFSREEFSRMTLRDIRPPEDVPMLEQMLSESPDGRASAEWRHRKKDGTLIYVTVRLARVTYGTHRARLAVVHDITERRLAEEKLTKSEATLRAILDNVPYLIWLKDTEGRFIAVNKAFFDTTGLAKMEDVQGMTDLDLWPREIAEKYRADDAEVMATRQQKLVEEESYDKGKVHLVETFKAPILDNNGKLIGTTGFSRDITQAKLAEQRLRQAIHYNRSLLEASLDPLVTISEDGKITDVNRATAEVTGVAREQLIGSDFSDYFTEPEKAREGYRHVFLQGFVNDYPLSIRHCDGHTTDVLYSASVYRDETGKVAGVFAAARDITKLKQMAAHVEHLAHFDALTDLPNRTLLNDRLQQALVKAKRDREHCALMFLDLDNFKPVNDTWGHAIGDQLLQEAGKRMRDSVRESDTVARLGGDEFVVLLPGAETAEDALVVAEKIRHVLNQPFLIGGHTLRVSSSIGVAVYPEHGQTEAELSNNADIAMYAAKQGGRNNVRLYQPGMAPGK